MWEVDSAIPEDLALLDDMQPVEVLYEFDGPRIFTLKDTSGALLLSSWCDEGENFDRYILAPTSDKILGKLRAGAVSVLEALDQPRAWLCDVSFDVTMNQIGRTLDERAYRSTMVGDRAPSCAAR